MVYKNYAVDVVRRTLSDTMPETNFVQHDENVDGVRFCLPAGFDEIELSGANATIRVTYTLPNGKKGQQILKAYAGDGLDTTYKYYAWDFASLMLSSAGAITFALCIIDEASDKAWNTTPATLQIPETLAPVLVL